jgi:hypothetical protein
MDDEGELDERVESVVGVLSSTTEEPLEGFAEELKRHWLQREAAEEAARGAGPTAEQAKEVQAFQARLAKEVQAAEEAARAAELQMQQRQRGDRTEARGREAILNKYGFDADAVDEDGNLVASASSGGGGSGVDAELGAMLGTNANKAQVAEAARIQRLQAKLQHEKKVEREKELLAKQKMKKEMEKRRTQKKEKQRGCG